MAVQITERKAVYILIKGNGDIEPLEAMLDDYTVMGGTGECCIIVEPREAMSRGGLNDWFAKLDG